MQQDREVIRRINDRDEECVPSSYSPTIFNLRGADHERK